MTPHARRIAALEESIKSRGLSFGGVLAFDSHTESMDRAVSRAPGPGIYLVIDQHSDKGVACELHADGQFTITDPHQ